MHKGPKKNATILDIARIAGVSHSTVSRCLNDSPLVSDETKIRIGRIAMEMNFQFNANARALVSQRTNTAAILYPVMYDDPRNLQYTKLLLHDLQENLANRGLDALMTSRNDRNTGQSNVIRLVSCRKIDGLIMIGTVPDTEDRRALAESGIPVVLVDPLTEIDEFDIYATNNVIGGLKATDCLLERGRCASPVTFSIGPDDAIFDQRSEGFRMSMRKHGLDTAGRILVLPNGSVFDAGYDFVSKNLELLRNLHVDGIFAQADLLALGIISALRENSVLVPGAIRVVGFDDASIATYFQPRLTTMHQPREEIARSAATRLRYLIDSATSLPRVVEYIPPQLVLRESC